MLNIPSKLTRKKLPSSYILNSQTIQPQKKCTTRNIQNAGENNAVSVLERKRSQLRKLKVLELQKIKEKKQRILNLQKKQKEAELMKNIQKEQLYVRKLQEEKKKLDRLEYYQQQKIKHDIQKKNNNIKGTLPASNSKRIIISKANNSARFKNIQTIPNTHIEKTQKGVKRSNTNTPTHNYEGIKINQEKKKSKKKVSFNLGFNKIYRIKDIAELDESDQSEGELESNNNKLDKKTSRSSISSSGSIWCWEINNN